MKFTSGDSGMSFELGYILLALIWWAIFILGWMSIGFWWTVLVFSIGLGIVGVVIFITLKIRGLEVG